MDSKKFDRLVHEFPILAKILTDNHLSAESIDGIQIRRADRNLLEAQPGYWHFDGGSCSSGGYRNFWIVSPGEIIRLKDASYKDEAYRGGGYTEKAGRITNQLAEYLNREICYVVEVTKEWMDYDEYAQPHVIIYKMKDFAWRRFVQILSAQD